MTPDMKRKELKAWMKFVTSKPPGIVRHASELLTA
jgi:hypothetical protein